MKAVLLAAGMGSRLSSLISDIPKPLLGVGGKPILQYNIELCRKHGIKKLFVNTHHHAEKIRKYFGDGTGFGVSITYSYEPELLGTAGALVNFREHLQERAFFVLYGDNFSDFNLIALKEKFNCYRPLAVIGFHDRDDISSSGVAEFDSRGRVTRFIEKPTARLTESCWVNAGIYYLNPKIFSYIPTGFSDFGKDIFPRLLEKGLPLYGVLSKADVRAFDTPEMYRESMKRLRAARR